MKNKVKTAANDSELFWNMSKDFRAVRLKSDLAVWGASPFGKNRCAAS